MTPISLNTAIFAFAASGLLASHRAAEPAPRLEQIQPPPAPIATPRPPRGPTRRAAWPPIGRTAFGLWRVWPNRYFLSRTEALTWLGPRLVAAPLAVIFLVGLINAARLDLF